MTILNSGFRYLALALAAGALLAGTPDAGAAEAKGKAASHAKTITGTATRTPLPADEKSAAKAKKLAVKAKKVTRTAHKKSASRPDMFAALVVNADTGEVLYEKNAGEVRYPASLTKMMTLYLTFDALKRGTLSMNQTLPVSAKAAIQPQTNIALDKGDRLPVKTAIESLVVRSANDSSMVLGEALGGTEFNFALAMTQKARELGMKNTVFRNPNGLPDDKQVTTAYDMARLAIALRRDFPEYYHFFKQTSFVHNGITYPGHNRVMERYAGADGVKTGYIRASGFNLVTSAQRHGHRLVGVVMGGTSGAARDKAMIALLDQTFAQLSSTGITHAKATPGRSADAERPEGRHMAETGQGDCSGAGCR